METQTTQTQETTKDTCCGTHVLVQSKRSQGAFFLVLVLLAVFLFAESIKSFKEYRFVGGGIAPTNAITVTGEGELFAVPDTAEFTFTITEEAKTSAEARKTATDKANEATKALVEKGIEEIDIKTIGYDLSPKYEWKTDYSKCVGAFPCEGNQQQVGFTISQSVSVKVRNLDIAGEMLELVISKGVSNVSGLNFTVADEDEIQAEVRKKAIDDAKAKADELAKDLGVTLVRIVGFYENGDTPMPMYATDMAQSYGMGEAKREAVSLPAGQNKMVSNVSITYEIR